MTISLRISEELMARIAEGPLKATEGRGVAPYVRKLIAADLDRFDRGESVQAKECRDAIKYDW